MDLYEANTHPFILKIWLEEGPEENEPAKWRGYIIHVPSGARRYIDNLDDVLNFIIPYLERMGVYVSQRPLSSKNFEPGEP